MAGAGVAGAEVLRASLTRAEEEEVGADRRHAGLGAGRCPVGRGLTEEVAALLANRLDVLEQGHRCHDHGPRHRRAGRDDRRAGARFDLLEYLNALGAMRLAAAMRSEPCRADPHARLALAGRSQDVVERLDASRPQAYERWGILGPLVQVQVGLARAYSNVVRQDWRRVLADLKAVDPIAQRLRRGRDRIQLLRALAMKRCGEDGAALLGEAISLSETLGLERVLVDTHPDLVDWARRIRGGDGGESPANQRPAAAPRPRARAGAHPRLAQRATTPKEREVLQLLASNMSNKEIALALGVATRP